MMSPLDLLEQPALSAHNFVGTDSLPPANRGASETHAQMARFASWQPGRHAWERRSGHRVRLDCPIPLVPVDDVTHEPVAEQRTVRGIDVSLNGICFSHVEPLPYSLVSVRFTLPNGRQATGMVRLKWCRFTRGGVYVSGGPFLDVSHAAAHGL